jgi:TRAP-type C4-dicarboxylate transport system substrate-binding protein
MSKTFVRALLQSLLVLAFSGAAWAQPVQLKLATFGPPQSYFYAEVVLPWAEAVSKDSGGTVQITHFGGGVLGHAGNIAKSSIIELPFGYDTGEAGAVAFWRLFAKGLTASDYDEVKLFGVTAWPAAAIQTKSKKVQRLEDLKGMKLRVSGKLQADTVLALGATPVAIAVDEIYQSIDKGVIDGAWASLTATRQFRLQEVAKNFLDVSLNGAGAMLIMNKQTFDKLPPQAKAAFEKHSGEALSRALGRSNDGEVVRVHQMLGELAKQKKIEPVYKLSDQELSRWRKGAEPIANEWAQRVPNGKAILEGFRAEVAALQKR